MKLKEIRINCGLTQVEAASYLNVSLRSYKTYENDKTKEDSFKYDYLCEMLKKYCILDEDHGILNLKKIKDKVNEVFLKHDINFCYLFGSYAKGKANESSDVDLIIDTKITGLDFFGLVEELRRSLCKRIDLLRLDQLANNEELLREVMKDGIKIYG